MGEVGHLYGVTILALVVNAIVFGLRILIRVRHEGAFGYDDIAPGVSFVAYIVFCSFTIVYLRNVPSIGFSLQQRQKAQKFYFLCQIAGVLAAPLIKTSVAIVLLRINARRAFRYVILVTLAGLWIASLLFVFYLAFQCRPLPLAWGVGDDDGTCLSLMYNFWGGVALSAADSISNWVYSLIPVAILWNVQMSPRAKVSVALLLGMGIISIATVVKLTVIAKSPIIRELTDQTFDTVNGQLSNLLWYHVELFLAMLVISLVALRPLLRYVTILGWGAARQRQPRWDCQPTVERELSIIARGGRHQCTGPVHEADVRVGDIPSQEVIPRDQCGKNKLGS